MPDIKKIEELLLEREGSVPRIVGHDLTDSTNTRAREYAKKHPTERNSTVFIADGQSSGRGRRGRSFFSEKGKGIYVSFLVYPEQKGISATSITAYAAVALSRAIEKATGLSPVIKWVNDLYLGGRKLAGILAECEMSQSGDIAYLVLGMGINVYKTELPDEISHIATSIEDVCGHKFSREELTAHIITEFLSGLSDPASDTVYSEYKKRLFIIGEPVTVIKPEKSYVARVLDVTRDFSLAVEREGGDIERLCSGEVSTKIIKDDK